MPRHLSRRRFLQNSVALGSASFFAQPTRADQQPGERVRVGIVGVAGQGGWNLGQVADSGMAEIVALCDVDASRAAPVRERYPQAKFYEDYRQMMDQKDVQAVLVATPDHHHAFAGLAALRAGKHLYCEKPLAHSVHEVRLMRDVAGRDRLVTQMGTQIHAGENYRRVVEIVQAGTIGPVRRVHVWVTTKPQPGRHVPPTRVPSTLNYDLWLGPAPQQSYPPFRHGENASVHFNWRWWWDFGGGILADLACHYMDLPHWALNLRHATSIAATGRVTYEGDNQMPDVMQVDFEYPARGAQPPVHLTWYHGVNGPDLEGRRTFMGFPSGILFEGEQGQLVANYQNYRLLPEDRFRDFQPPRPTIARSPGHHREWLQAIRSGGTTTCNFDYSGALTETVLLGNVAYRAGGRIQYDATTGQVSGNPNAAQYLRREYRRGWSL
jgi:predicted dehydrogenase